jgi:hypothetical protein
MHRKIGSPRLFLSLLALISNAYIVVIQLTKNRVKSLLTSTRFHFAAYLSAILARFGLIPIPIPFRVYSTLAPHHTHPQQVSITGHKPKGMA